MSDRSNRISRLLESRASREAYIGAKLKVLIPSQIRALRLKSQTPRQEDLANAAEMKQSRISAMETPGAVNFNLETLVRIAAALKVGLEVKFVSFSNMLKWENDFSQDDFNAVRIEDDTQFINGIPEESPQWVTGILEGGIVRRQATQEAFVALHTVRRPQLRDQAAHLIDLNYVNALCVAVRQDRIIFKQHASAEASAVLVPLFNYVYALPPSQPKIKEGEGNFLWRVGTGNPNSRREDIHV